MIRKTILTLALTSTLTGAAAAQYAVRGGPLPPQRGPSLYTGAYAPSFYYGPQPMNFGGPGAGAGYLPNYSAYPPVNGGAFTVPTPVQVSQPYYPQVVYYPQSAPATFDATPPLTPPSTGPGASRSLSTETPVASATPRSTVAAAHFTVKVPADAKVWVNDAETKQPGTSRRFHVPTTLEAGRTYEYVFRAQWAENGQTVTRDRTIRFQPGDDLTVDFTEAPAR
jgi:uncharacterized protein (TIGR03000 family)